MMWMAVDGDGKVRASDRHTASIAPPISQDTARWIRIASRLEVPRGRYQIRIAARRSDGNAEGSVFTEVDVPDFSRGVSAGTLSIGPRVSAGVARADRLSAALPVMPMATRAVPLEMNIHAALPLRVSMKHRDRRIQFVTSLTGPDGSTREIQRVVRAARVFTGPAGATFETDGPLPLNGPGDYRLKVEVFAGDERPQHREAAFRVVAGS